MATPVRDLKHLSGWSGPDSCFSLGHSQKTLERFAPLVVVSFRVFHIKRDDEQRFAAFPPHAPCPCVFDGPRLERRNSSTLALPSFGRQCLRFMVGHELSLRPTGQGRLAACRHRPMDGGSSRPFPALSFC